MPSCWSCADRSQERLLSIEGSHLNGCGVMEGGEGAAAGTDAAIFTAMQVLLSPCRPAVRQANISFDGIEAEALLLYLDMKGVSVSAGAACSAGALEPSHVLTAMGISPELAKGTIRISLDETNTQADAEFLMESSRTRLRACEAWQKDFRTGRFGKNLPAFHGKTDENHFCQILIFPLKNRGYNKSVVFWAAETMAAVVF